MRLTSSAKIRTSARLFVPLTFLVASSLLRAQYIIDTVAGNGPPSGVAATSVSLYGATATDSAGNLYISDAVANRVFKVDANGIIAVAAGTGGSNYSGEGGPAVSASLSPGSLAISSSGDLFISDYINKRVYKVSAGIITTVAGNGLAGFTGDGGPAVNAELVPSVLAVDGSGNLYIADQYRLRKVSGGVITTIAGTGTAGYSGDGGPAVNAQLGQNFAIAADSTGNIYLADNNRIRKITGATIDTISGDGTAAFFGDGHPAIFAEFNGPSGIAVDSSGNIYISDSGNSRVREISGGLINTIAGTGVFGYSGDGALATNAQIAEPSALAVDVSGRVYLYDSYNYRIRRISGGIITTVAGNGYFRYSGDNGPAIDAQLYPFGLAVDNLGNVYFTDYTSNRVRKISGGIITTVAGNGTSGNSGDGGPAVNAQLSSPGNIAFDGAGNLYINEGADIRKVSGGIITTIVSGSQRQPLNCRSMAAGNAGTLYLGLGSAVYEGGSFIVGGPGYCCDNGPAASALISYAKDLAVDASGANLYIADIGNYRVRKVTNGIITTVAGDGTTNFAPSWLALDSAGRLYISTGSQILQLNGSVLTPIAGQGTSGYSGDGGPALNAQITPGDLAIDGAGNIYFSDYVHIRRLRPLPQTTVTTLPAGLTIKVDGTTYTAPQPFYWSPGTTHTISLTTPQTGGANSQYTFTGWADGPTTNPRTITAPSAATTYTANFATTGGAAAITAPAPGSTLASTAVTFTWNTTPGATGYWLDVGTTPFVGNIFGGPVGLVTSKQVAGLPSDGSTVYVSLYSNINGSYTDSNTGAYYRNSYTYTAMRVAAMIAPTPNSSLGGASTTFIWTPAAGATNYWLDVGTTPLVGNIFGGPVGNVTSKLVSGLPVDGTTIYVSLYSNINGSYTDAAGAYFRNSYSYSSLKVAAITTPQPNSLLSTRSATFTWAAVTGATEYWLDVGSKPFVGDFFGGPLGTATSKQLTGLPLDGSVIYVSLYSKIFGSYQDSNGVYLRNSYTYTAARIGKIVSPAPSSTLSGTSVIFTWVPYSGPDTQYWLDVGTAPLVGNIFGGSVGNAWSKQVTGLPVDGSTIYVSLYTKINGSYLDNGTVFLRNSYTFTSGP